MVDHQNYSKIWVLPAPVMKILKNCMKKKWLNIRLCHILMEDTAVIWFLWLHQKFAGTLENHVFDVLTMGTLLALYAPLTPLKVRMNLFEHLTFNLIQFSSQIKQLMIIIIHNECWFPKYSIFNRFDNEDFWYVSFWRWLLQSTGASINPLLSVVPEFNVVSYFCHISCLYKARPQEIFKLGVNPTSTYHHLPQKSGFKKILRIILGRCKRRDLEKISAWGGVNLKSSYNHSPPPCCRWDWDLGKSEECGKYSENELRN